MKILLAEDASIDRLPGRNATFEVVRPSIVQPPVTDEVPQEIELRKVPGSGTILFVEDEPSIREMTTMYLEAVGYRVIEASDSADALTRWEGCGGEIDLVVTDLRMPGGLNGRQLVERLQAGRPDLRAIFVSGYQPDLCGGETFFGQTNRFLQKPYRLRDLAELVQTCLAGDEEQ